MPVLSSATRTGSSLRMSISRMSQRRRSAPKLLERDDARRIAFLLLTLPPNVLMLFSWPTSLLRDDLRVFDGAKDELYYRIDRALRELASPNLHDVNLVTAFKVELSDRYRNVRRSPLYCTTAASN